MKHGIIVFLISILIIVLLLSTFIGANYQEGYKEGITGNDLTIVNAILLGDDADLSIQTISNMGLKDPDFKQILDSDFSNDEKVSQLKALTELIASNSNIKGNDLYDSWGQDLSLQHIFSTQTTTKQTTTASTPTTTKQTTAASTPTTTKQTTATPTQTTTKQTTETPTQTTTKQTTAASTRPLLRWFSKAR